MELRNDGTSALCLVVLVHDTGIFYLRYLRTERRSKINSRAAKRVDHSPLDNTARATYTSVHHEAASTTRSLSRSSAERFLPDSRRRCRLGSTAMPAT